MIFSTVKSLIETVGRTRARNFGDLDTLTCIWTGPSWQADSAPGIGAKHPQYPSMECKGNRKISEAADITRIQVDYVGLFDGGTIGPVAKGFTTTESELEFSYPAWSQTGEVDITYPGAQATSTTGAVPGIAAATVVTKIYTWKAWVQNYITRYVSRSYTFKYAAYQAQRPRFSGGDILSSTTRQGSQSSVTYLTGTELQIMSTTSNLFGTGPWGAHEEIYCASFQAEPISPNWFRCTEVWSARWAAG